MRPAGHAVVGRLDHLLGRDALLPGSGGPTEAEQAGDLGHRQPGLAVEQEMTEQAGGIIIVAGLLAVAEGRAQDRVLGGGQALGDDTGLGKPLKKGIRRGRHG